jgi:hypothetical protein
MMLGIRSVPAIGLQAPVPGIPCDRYIATAHQPLVQTKPYKALTRLLFLESLSYSWYSYTVPIYNTSKDKDRRYQEDTSRKVVSDFGKDSQ